MSNLLERIRLQNGDTSTPKASPRISLLKKGLHSGSKSPFRSPFSNLSNSPSPFPSPAGSIANVTPDLSGRKTYYRGLNSPFMVYDGNAWHKEQDWIENQMSSVKARLDNEKAQTIEPISLSLDFEEPAQSGNTVLSISQIYTPSHNLQTCPSSLIFTAYVYYPSQS